MTSHAADSPTFALAQSSLLTVEPDVPRDPLAAAASAEEAVARHLAVLGVPVEERGLRILRALAALDALLAEGLPRDASDSLQASERAGAVSERAVSDRIGAGHEAEAPTWSSESDGFAPAGVDEPPPVEPALAARAAMSAAPPSPPATKESDVAEAFVRAGSRERHQFAAAETIVLSGPDIKRKIRHKQSIMPSYISQVLYDDIGALFEIGDREGALVSLERLLTIAPISPQIETFLAHNEARLLEYYESVLGPWSRVVKLRDGAGGMPPAYFNFEKMARVVSLLDGTRPLARVLTESGLRQIEACAVLSQLARSASLDLGQKP